MGSADYIVIAVFSLLCMCVGAVYTRLAAKKGGEGFFTANRSLAWWAVGISNSATYQSGLGGFVMLIFVFGLVGNWLWWAQWIVWMPLVAIIWARMWRRMQIVTTAELISLRYGGRPAYIARKMYALAMFCFAVIIIAYITGFFAKTIAPLVPLTATQILLIFGTVTVVYTMLGGLMGSVMVAVVQLVVMIGASMVFLCVIVPQFGGWQAILQRVDAFRQGGLSLSPLSEATPPLTLTMFVLLGLFFAGSPTAGEGMTAQRFMAARSERHAIGGQLFNALIALSLRIVPLVGLGIICMSVFWHENLVDRIGPCPAGFITIDDPVHAWGELIKASTLPPGFVGLLAATEIAAFMSTLSALVNWGSSFIVNDFYIEFFPQRTQRQEVLVSRLTTLTLFVFAAVVAILFVDDMVSWFLFINSVVVIFWLPLAYYRFFWSRFNAFGELAATILGLPVSILVWFVLGFEDKPIWMGTGVLLAVALGSTAVVTMLTPQESEGTLKRFYMRCRPMLGWRRFRRMDLPCETSDPPLGHLIFDSLLGMLTCLGLALATNAVFVGNHLVTATSGLGAAIFGGWLVYRCIGERAYASATVAMNEDSGGYEEHDAADVSRRSRVHLGEA